MTASRHLAAAIGRRPGRVLALALALVVLGGLLVARLRVRGDLTELLPRDRASVIALEQIRSRVTSSGTLFVLVESDDEAQRCAASAALTDRLSRLGPDLVARIETDGRATRDYVWGHRFLFAELTDLRAARDALADSIRKAKLAHNPLYVDLEDDGEAERAADPPTSLREQTAELRARLDQAHQRQGGDARVLVSTDGALQLVIVRAGFAASDTARDARLVAAAEAAAAEVRAAHGVEVGLTGDVVTTLGEHRSILRGMAIATGLTAALVALAMFAFLRSVGAVAAVLAALTTGTIATFALTELLIGHLNLATAFLSAIVLGNGINPGIIVAARYLEERRGGGTPDQALAIGLPAALRATLAASSTAAVAYGALLVTEFRGFRDFGAIGGVGMVACWLSAVTVLPAALLALDRRGWLHLSREPRVGGWLGGWLARFVPARAHMAGAIALSVGGAAAVVAATYVASRPLESDWRQLRSQDRPILAARAWNDRLTGGFPQGFNRGLANAFVIAAPDEGRLTAAVTALRAHDAALPTEQRTFGAVRTVADLVPAQQADKLALLSEIRAMIDRDLTDALGPDDRALLAELRPPDDLRPVGLTDVPDAVRRPFVERDGSVGKIGFATSAARFSTWNVDDLAEFADQTRAIALPNGVALGGQAFVFADMLRAMRRDIPLASGAALIGAVLCILVTVGRGRHAGVTILCAVLGTVAMVAVVALLGLKVNFLDFIALPITIGIGVDYAVNLTVRARLEPALDARTLAATTGGAVLLCSLTTVIGYGALLLSDNAGIRSFGLAAVIGELTCFVAALWLAPALVGRSVARSPVARSRGAHP